MLLSGPTPAGAHVPALDGIRGSAVLVVVAFHLWPGALPGGWLGVDVFFVLSGYLITSLMGAELGRTDRVGLAAFWARRARRLLPALLVVLVAVMLAGQAWLAPWQLRSLRDDALASLFYVANWRFIAVGDSYFAEVSPSPLQHLWSLAIEEQFYLVWPLAVLGLWRLLGGRRRRLAVVTGLLALASAVWMAVVAGATDDGPRAYFGTGTRVQAILIGAMVGLLVPLGTKLVGNRRRLVGGAGWVALVILGVLCLIADGEEPWLYRGGFTLIAVLAATGVLAGAALGPRSGIAQALSVRPLAAVGRVSYGLYLWHWPVIVLLTASRTGLDGAALDVFRIAVFTAATLVSYRFVERPARRTAQPPRVVLARSALAMPVVAAVILAASWGSAPRPSELDATPGDVVLADPQADAGPGDSSPATTAPGAPAPGRPPRVAVAGDSVGLTLAVRSGNPPGLDVRGGGIVGCGVLPVPADRCATWYELWDAVAAEDPDVVLVSLGVWESTVIDGAEPRYVPGTPEATALLGRQLDEAIRHLPEGVPVAVLDVPCLAETDDPEVLRDPVAIEWVNRVLVDWVARLGDRAELVPISELVCPDGTADAEVDGVVLRPDGRHYSSESAPIAWEWLRPYVERLAAGDGADGGGG